MNTSWQQVFRPETEIHWGPWIANLGHLVRSGWECRIEEHDYMRRERFMYLRNKQLDVVGMSESISIDDQFNSLQMGRNRLRINMQLHRSINFQTTGDMPDMVCHDVKVGVMHNPVTYDITYYFDKGMPEEIIIEPQTVAEMLDTIRSMQSDDAKQLLHSQRMREDSTNSGPVVDTRLSAKILTFAR